MMKACPHPRQQYRLALQAVMSAGEAVGDAVFAYCRDELGVVVNEMFGQTEINYIVGNCAMNDDRSQGVGWPARPGSMGRAYPGHRIAVLDDTGRECAIGEPGDVALHRRDVHGQPDPIFFLGYWKNADATGAKFTDMTGFQALLLADQDRVARCMIEKLLTFATGHAMGFSDRPAIERLVAQSKAKGHGMRDLIHAVVQSEIFRSK
jgi:acyl-coenzyme A synthetase/AMP-(fatty) acid ligase